MNIPHAIKQRITHYTSKLSAYPKLQTLYKNCYSFTVTEDLLHKCSNGTYFLATGDIPAMWLRDSTAQITHYLPLSGDSDVAEIIEGVIKRQLMYIEIDPYANSFNKTPNGKGHPDDLPKNHPFVFERKYEVDSLCYPIRLLYLYWKNSGREEIIKSKLEDIAEIIVNQFKTEQHHFELSPYTFYRKDLYNGWEWDSLPNGQKGNPVAYTGMTWSGFRPSDDGCLYGYLTASEMFAVVILGYMAEMLEEVCRNTELALKCRLLREEIDRGIRQYCVTEHEKYGRIYAYETDGMGNYVLQDDANIPDLLSIPYLGYESADSEIYQNTRRFLLSRDNPYYFEGKYAKGIGSPHTPDNYIWHMALIIQGLTSVSAEEKRGILKALTDTDAGTGFMHEGFNADNPFQFTRASFGWPNALAAEFIEKCADEKII
ncbi:MAG: glycoside hydrolase family 125 protein [Monoglobaceae bacterium]